MPRCNARAELRGARLRDNADAKRCTVSGSIVWLIEPEPIHTSPTSRARRRDERRAPRGRARCTDAWPEGRLPSKKRTI